MPNAAVLIYVAFQVVSVAPTAVSHIYYVLKPLCFSTYNRLLTQVYSKAESGTPKTSKTSVVFAPQCCCREPCFSSSSRLCFAAFRRRADAKAVQEIDPSSRSAKDSVARLEKLQHDKNEKMKEEAIGELSWATNLCSVETLYWHLLDVLRQ